MVLSGWCCPTGFAHPNGAKRKSGPRRNTSSRTVSVTNTWTQTRITDIQVTNGQAEIGLWSDAKAGNWTNLDNMEFFPTAPAATAAPPLPVTLVSFQADWQGADQAALGHRF